MSESQVAFLEMPNVSLDDADVAVICAPFEGTVSYGKGTAAGPAAILTASTHLETFDEELGFDHEGHLRYCVLPPVEPAMGERVEAYLTRLRAACAGYGLAPPFYLGLGGEHSVTAPMLEGILADPSRVTVVQIDAHADLREEYQGTRFNHACAMRRVLDAGVKRLVAVGIRSAEAEEYRLAQEDPRIHTFYAHQLEGEGEFARMLEFLRAIEGPIHLTVDIDGLACSLCPGTGTPQPGGLSWLQMLEVSRALTLHSAGELIGMDICEVAPQEQSRVNEMVAAKLAFKTIGYRFRTRSRS